MDTAPGALPRRYGAPIAMTTYSRLSNSSHHFVPRPPPMGTDGARGGYGIEFVAQNEGSPLLFYGRNNWLAGLFCRMVKKVPIMEISGPTGPTETDLVLFF